MSVAVAEEIDNSSESNYLCISEAAGGVIKQNGEWQGTSYLADDKYLVVTENGNMKSVKEFGMPDDWTMENCYALEPTKSFACVNNFNMFRFQPSTRKFVMVKSMGYTSELEEAGGMELSGDIWAPSVSVGLCEKF